ncbi:serine/threonine protein kinase [Streptomyces odontomachi]|uniref:serine/threonine protein kinase n=1 Tax=Streptomyces odontomachi TaxID=2944940 RepID=UPI00210DE947|nr:serine/threonine protein kinase [Streptomyces sp. ODS25]
MAERSTAAVDVAAGGGDETPSAEAEKDTTDGVAQSRKRDTVDTAADGTDRPTGSDGTPAADPTDDTADSTSETTEPPQTSDKPDPDPVSRDTDTVAIGSTAAEPLESAEKKVDETTDKPAHEASDEPTGKPVDEAAVETAVGTIDAEPHASEAAASSEPVLKTPPAPELHSGYKLARRYRLEECVTRLDGFSSWRAVDEKLRRAVGVHLLLAEHPRARSVLAAARSSALLGDPRFVQVLDAVEENDLVYVVHEWLPDATELTALLASGPLEVHDAYQMVTQVTQAMTAAHREGLAHLRLTPSAVLRTSTGQWRVRGLAVNAALRGITSTTPQRTDTEAIGALLYAALTRRWPYENDAYGLSGLPKGVGLIAPDQVRAGVHRGLSQLAMRALVNDGATASRQEPPCTTPEELLEAVSAMPRIPPPEPAFTPPPEYRSTTYQQGVYGRTPTAGVPGSPVVVTPPPPLQSRTGRVLKWGVSALLIVALGLGSWQLAEALMERGNDSGHPHGTSEGVGGSGKKTTAGKPLKIDRAKEFEPSGSGISEDKVGKAIDSNPDTAWVTPSYYNYANFGRLSARKDGSGIVVDLGRVQEVTGFDLALYRSGQKLEVLAADSGASNPSVLSDFPQRLTRLDTVGSALKKSLSKPVRTRYVLIHITSLPPESQNQYRGGISEIKVLGRPSE